MKIDAQHSPIERRTMVQADARRDGIVVLDVMLQGADMLADLRAAANDLVAAIPNTHRARGAPMDRHEIVALTRAALDINQSDRHP